MLTAIFITRIYSTSVSKELSLNTQISYGLEADINFREAHRIAIYREKKIVVHIMCTYSYITKFVI